VPRAEKESARRSTRRIVGAAIIAIQVGLSVSLLYAALRIGDWSRGEIGSRAFAQAPEAPFVPPPIETAPPKGDEPAPLRALADVPRVASYTLEASLDAKEHVVHGKGTITFTNRSRAALDELWVHLYLNAFEGLGTRFMRKSPAGFRGTRSLPRLGGTTVSSFRVREWDADVWPEDTTTPGDPRDRTDVRVPLPRTIAPGETVHVDLAFDSKLPSIVLRTGFDGTFNMVAQWFPKLAKLEDDGRFGHFPFERFSEFYADYGDYDVTIDVPKSYVVGAVGERAETREDGDRRIDRYTASAVHDFAFAAWDGFVEVDDTAGGVAIRCLVPSGYGGVADQQIEAAKQGLDVYGKHFGAYPYSTLTLVHPPPSAGEAGGMEYPTLITTGGSYWEAYTATRSMALLTLHELGHQWFYGLVATDEHTFPFLDEGGATYATGVAAEELYGDHQLSSLLVGSVAAGERVYAAGVHARAPVSSPSTQS
jgi:hypothetical protein